MMIRKLVATLILVPLGIVIVALAVANRDVVTVSFDPFSATAPAFVVKLPLFVLVFVLVIAGVIVGGVAAWLKQGRVRRTARRLNSELRKARAEAGELRQRLAAAEAAPLASRPPLMLRPPAA